MARVLVAMSGGVDSSVAAHLLKEQGHEVMGAFLRLGEGGMAAEKSKACCTIEDAIDARRVADRLGVSFYSFNYAGSFRKVIDYFVDEYQQGRTPNPCARCNQWIKFDTFHDLARDLGLSDSGARSSKKTDWSSGRLISMGAPTSSGAATRVIVPPTNTLLSTGPTT